MIKHYLLPLSICLCCCMLFFAWKMKPETKPLEIQQGNDCSELKLQIRVMLQGVFDENQGEMVSQLTAAGLLQRFENNGEHPGRRMNTGFNVPATAIDRIQVYLRSTDPPYERVDSAFGWLQPNGNMLNYATGQQPFLTFCHASIQQEYFIEVSHRNHLNIFSSIAYGLSTGQPESVDLTIGENIQGEGIKRLGPTMVMMMGGDVDQNNEINAADISLAEQNFNENGYLKGDINLDGVVDETDRTMIKKNAVNLHFSEEP